MTEHVNPDTGEVVTTASRSVPTEIIKARIAVMKDAYGVGKSGRNAFHNYDYASDYDVLSLVQPSMAKHGLILEMWPDEVIGPDENGNMWVRFMMQWQHESGACSDPAPWYGVAQDRDKQGRMGDKWFNKAATAAEKYFLLKQFHIPAGKDVDPDRSAHEAHPPYAGSQPPARQTVKRGSQTTTQGRDAAPASGQHYTTPPVGQREGTDSAGHSKRVHIQLPERPELIPVPVPGDGQDMDQVWRAWAAALHVALKQCAEVEDINAWMDANRQPLERLGRASTKARQHIDGIADKLRGQLAQKPLETV